MCFTINKNGEITMKRFWAKRRKKLTNGICEFLDKFNWLYIAIVFMVIIGVGILVSSYWIIDNDLKNIFVGLGTGIVTSALVSLYIDAINRKIEKRKLNKYKNMILNPLYNAVRSLYIHVALNINEYRVREDISGYLFLPMDETKVLGDFFNGLKEYEVEVLETEKKKKLYDMLCVSEVFYREVISQFRGLPLDSLLYENLLLHDEYEKLKKFDIVNVCMRNISKISEESVSEKEEYALRIQLLHGMLLLINRILKVFPDMAKKISTENNWIKNNLDDIYINEIYPTTEAYAVQMMERMEAEAEYYAEHPEEWDPPEETEEDILHRKINTAIWAGDKDIIKQCFPEIDKNNKQIQSELTWSVAKDVMKDRELRELYYKKYGEKYRMRRDGCKLLKKLNRYFKRHLKKKR